MEKVKVELLFVVTNPDGGSMSLGTGDEVIINTDCTEFEETYSGKITFLNEDEIEVEYLGNIPWKYIVDVSPL